MRNLVFVLTLFFLTLTACSQQRSYHEDTLTYLELNGTEQQYSNAVDQMFVMLKQQYTDKNIPESVWQELQNNKTAALTNIKSLLVSAYRGNFSHDDIKALITFYESDTGMLMVKDINQLTEDQKVKLSVFFESEVGKKVQNQSESLKMMVSEVSELWSRDLYKETVSKIKAKGY